MCMKCSTIDKHIPKSGTDLNKRRIDERRVRTTQSTLFEQRNIQTLITMHIKLSEPINNKTPKDRRQNTLGRYGWGSPFDCCAQRAFVACILYC